MKKSLKMAKKPVNTGKTQVWIFIITAAFLSAVIFYFMIPRGSARIDIERPAAKIELPSGIRMFNPYGYNIFRSDSYGYKVHSFIKYDAAWEGNAFFKVDLTVLPPEKTGASGNLEGAELDALVRSIKVTIQEQRKQELEKDPENTGTEAYEHNYGAFKPAGISTIKTRDRDWKKQVLEGFEAGDEKEAKLWTNIYAVYKGNIMVIDYMTAKDTDKTIIKEIEADIRAMLEGIHFD